MKRIFFSLILMLVATAGSAITAQAQRNQTTVSVRVNQQKSIPRTNLTIRFVSLVEDSRCPEGTRCVWAGNARIQVRITGGRGRSETFEMNTNTGAKGASFNGYAINLVSLEPRLRENVRLNRNAYTATFRINKLTR